MTTETHAALHRSSQRLVRAVDVLTDEEHAAPSLLPGWTRAHVVAHLALNAEGLAGALHGVLEGRAVPMYPSPEARDAAIDDLAAAGASVLRDRLLGSVTELDDVLGGLPEDRRDAVVERTPGSDRTFLAGEVASMRWREVEVHHADLGTTYSPADWPQDFAVLLVDQLAGRAAATLRAEDLGRTWPGPEGAPTVNGTAAALGWWLTGRPGGGLTAEGGPLPGVAPW